MDREKKLRDPSSSGFNLKDAFVVPTVFGRRSNKSPECFGRTAAKYDFGAALYTKVGKSHSEI